MKPLNQYSLKSFVRYPNKQPKVFSPKSEIKPTEKSKPIPMPAEVSKPQPKNINAKSGHLPRFAQPKDHHRENKYITEQIKQFEKSQQAILGSPQPNASNQKRSFDTSRDQSDPTPRKPQSNNPAAEYSLSPEDKSLLLYLLQMKYMTMEQIDRKFLKDQKSAESFRKLLTHGYIKTKDPNLSPAALITPTEKAYDCLKIENQGKDLPRPTRRLFDPIINHDLKLVDLRIRFEELNYINKWFSESMLEEVPLMKRLFQDLPDAVCKKKNEKGYFLELEISQKSNKRYEERIALYEQALLNDDIKEAGIEGVIFLCTDEKVAQVLKSKLPKSKSFSVLMLSRYLKDKEVAA